jgi:hypothetical protein
MLTIPYHLITIFSESTKDGWNLFPNLVSSQKIGGRFIQENKYAIARVTSAVVKGD